MSDRNQSILQFAEEVITKAPLVSYDYPEEEPTVHALRKEVIDIAKKKIYSSFERYTQTPDYLISIRWFYTQKLIDFSHYDPLIPQNVFRPNLGFNSEVFKLHGLLEDIEAILKEVSATLDTFKKVSKITPNLNVNVQKSDLSYIFQLGQHRFELPYESYDKLLKLHKKDDLQRIHVRIFNLLCRYEALTAPGYHAAIPEKLFDLLRTGLKVNHELFASPFNCNLNLGNYTSAYPDTDKFFGSKGNFFNVYPKLFENGGSFEANPPFLEEHMTALSLIVNKALEREVPLSFVVVYPTWEDCLGYQILKDSKHLKNLLEYNYGTHFYEQSSQYWLKGKTRTANSRSTIFILQNALGMKKYPIDDDLIREIDEIFMKF